MAGKRMFSSQITESDAFQDMPLSAQALYFHLGMKADDDGFLGNPKRVQKMLGCCEDDMKLLIAKRFIYCFDTGICVIKHWKMHNTIQKDRYKPTIYEQERKLLEVKENRAYTVKQGVCIQDGNILDTDWIRRLDKSSIDILSETEVSDDASFDAEEIEEPFNDAPVGGECGKNDNDHIEYNEIINYLNEKTGSHYQCSSKSTRAKIKARYNEGYTFNDFKKVIDIKCKEWLNDQLMCNYLRPVTLFGPKFESYLNQKPSINTKKEDKEDIWKGYVTE